MQSEDDLTLSYVIIPRFASTISQKYLLLLLFEYALSPCLSHNDEERTLHEARNLRLWVFDASDPKIGLGEAQEDPFFPSNPEVLGILQEFLSSHDCSGKKEETWEEVMNEIVEGRMVPEGSISLFYSRTRKIYLVQPLRSVNIEKSYISDPL
jgi:hypothetical protein